MVDESVVILPYGPGNRAESEKDSSKLPLIYCVTILNFGEQILFGFSGKNTRDNLIRYDSIDTYEYSLFLQRFFLLHDFFLRFFVPYSLYIITCYLQAVRLPWLAFLSHIIIIRFS